MTKQRTAWKVIIRKHGLQKVIEHPERYMVLKIQFYSKTYIKQLTYKLKKHHEPHDKKYKI